MNYLRMSIAILIGTVLAANYGTILAIMGVCAYYAGLRWYAGR
jgi:hypothetical protein